MAKHRLDALLKWLTTATEAEIEQIGVSHSYLRLIAYGHKQPSARVAACLERLTQKAITRQQLRPNDWQVIWPELIATDSC